MPDKYFLLLEELYNRYDISAGTTLNKFIEVKYHASPADINLSGHLRVILERLAYFQRIEWKISTKEELSSGFGKYEYLKDWLGTERDGIKYTFENVYSEVQLTLQGWDYVGELLDNNKTKKSLVLTNRWIIGTYITLCVLGVCTGFIQYITYAQQNKVPQLQQQIQSYQDTLIKYKITFPH